MKKTIDAIRNVAQDIKEGSDIIMVKPAGYYLDIVREIKNQINLPLASFQVSGEFSMIKLASENGILNYEKINIFKASKAKLRISGPNSTKLFKDKNLGPESKNV